MNARSLLPALAWTGTYRRAWLGRDVFAGIVLTAILVPAGMGYAEASGLPAIVGLYATIVPLLAYAALGPSRILVLGPDLALLPLIAAVVVPLVGRQPGPGDRDRGAAGARRRGRDHRGRGGAARVPDRSPVRARPAWLPERHRPDRLRQPAARGCSASARLPRPDYSTSSRRSRPASRAGRPIRSRSPSASPAWPSSWVCVRCVRAFPGSSSLWWGRRS